jgi:hypothetical protein
MILGIRALGASGVPERLRGPLRLLIGVPGHASQPLASVGLGPPPPAGPGWPWLALLVNRLALSQPH